MRTVLNGVQQRAKERAKARFRCVRLKHDHHLLVISPQPHDQGCAGGMKKVGFPTSTNGWKVLTANTLARESMP